MFNKNKNTIWDYDLFGSSFDFTDLTAAIHFAAELKLAFDYKCDLKTNDDKSIFTIEIIERGCDNEQ